jgi:hypothetical protein
MRKRLAALPTRLAAMDDLTIKELVNLGYHLADWHMPYLNKGMAQRLHSISASLPFPEAPLWAAGDGGNQNLAC